MEAEKANRDMYAYIIGAAIVSTITVVALIWKPLYKALTLKKAPDHESEAFLYKAGAKPPVPFPSIFDPPSLRVSVCVPAYNEAARIGPMMADMLGQLAEMEKKDKSFTWEIIVVDDGSTKDNTADHVYSTYAATLGDDKFRVLKLFRNNGKGGAVRKGMMRARGEYLLMADADGATAAHELSNVMSAIQRVERNGLGIAVGSRAHLEAAEDGAKANRTPLRRFLMWGFHTFITLMIGGTDIKDTQCGFKLFTRQAAQLLFPVQHIDRWAFDVELLFLAARHRIPVVEVPVEWNEIDGSNLNVLTSTIEMMRDITAIRLCYTLGIWTDKVDIPERGAPSLLSPSPAPSRGAAASEDAAPSSASKRAKSPRSSASATGGTGTTSSSQSSARSARKRHA